MGYLWLCNIMSIESFTDRALRVLFSSESSEADWLIVNIGLHWLFSILSIASPDQDLGTHVRREDLVKEGHLCRENLETNLSTMPFHYPSDEDHTEALIMAVSDRNPTYSGLSYLLRIHAALQAFYAIDNSKPSLAWSFCSGAAQRCLSLGLHREHIATTQRNHFRNRKKWLFWTTYVIDKALSLRLGRPTNLPDFVRSPPPPPTSTIREYHDIPSEMTTYIMTAERSVQDEAANMPSLTGHYGHTSGSWCGPRALFVCRHKLRVMDSRRTDPRTRICGVV